MARARSRRAKDRLTDWPDSPEAEYRRPDPTRYRTKLGGFFARHARGPEDIETARAYEERLAYLYLEAPR